MPSVVHILDVTDGTVTVNLASGIAHLEEDGYVPQTPETEAKELSLGPLGDGGNLYGITRRNLAETVRVIVKSPSTDDLRLWLNMLEDLFLRAELYQNHRAGTRVYAQIQLEGDAATYRSEILRGRVMLPKEALDGDWSNRQLTATVFWERRFYWENTSETELPLYNTSVGSKQTGGLTVYNHDDSGTGHDNWVEIDGADVGGVLPCPVRAKLENNYFDVEDAYKAVYVGHNIWADPANFQHVLESENAGYVRGTTSVSDSSCSNGYKSTITWSSLSVWSEMVRWTLSNTYMASSRGRYFRVFLRFDSIGGTPDSDCQLRARLRLSTTAINVICEGPIVQGGQATSLYDMGVVQMPPWLMGETGLEQIYLSVWALADSGEDTWNLDCAFIMPLDSYHYYHSPFGEIFYYQDYLMDDGPAGYWYLYKSIDAAKTGAFDRLGSQILLWPGQKQRLHFLIVNSEFGDTSIGKSLLVKLYYRERRLTL